MKICSGIIISFFLFLLFGCDEAQETRPSCFIAEYQTPKYDCVPVIKVLENIGEFEKAIGKTLPDSTLGAYNLPQEYQNPGTVFRFTFRELKEEEYKVCIATLLSHHANVYLLSVNQCKDDN